MNADITTRRLRGRSLAICLLVFVCACARLCQAQTESRRTVPVNSLRGLVLCGYQGWFRCPGDPAGLGWIHWSRDSQRIAPETLSFEMWPDMTEYSAQEQYPTPGFTYPDGRPASLYSAANPRTVLRHFEWMRDYGIDGVWLQHFVVDLPGGSSENRYSTRLSVLNQIRTAAKKTGRAWALAYDIAGTPTDRIYDLLTANWKKLVDEGVTRDTRYVHEAGKPVVQIWGFYRSSQGNMMTTALAERLIDFFKSPGPYTAFLVGGGDWDWRRNPDPKWIDAILRLDAYSPWNIGNYAAGKDGIKRASIDWWGEDKRVCDAHHVLWIPSVYPGFSWDNLQRKAPGTTIIPRRGGMFLWEQFAALERLGVTSANIAMFDEVDEGTAIFKVTSAPPTQAHFVGLENYPSDWYLRLVGTGTKMLRKEIPHSDTIPFKPYPVKP